MTCCSSLCSSWFRPGNGGSRLLEHDQEEEQSKPCGEDSGHPHGHPQRCELAEETYERDEQEKGPCNQEGDTYCHDEEHSCHPAKRKSHVDLDYRENLGQQSFHRVSYE